MTKLKEIFKKEAVLIISLILALVSAFFVTPDKEYIGYIDFRTLALLLCLMLVMSGLNGMGIFSLLADKLLQKTKSTRSLSLTLILLCFFSSMLITNDVALITFVPFTLIALRLSGQMKKAVSIVVLETVAANLGSMLTPIGNPQNLYLFSAFEMEMGEFIGAVLPYAVLSLVLLVLCVIFTKSNSISVSLNGVSARIAPVPLTVYILLFILSLLTVFRVIPYGLTLAVTLAAVLAVDRKNILRADYSLLLTFVFLFIFIGNLGRIDFINSFLQSIVSGREVIVGVLASQVFSNVPAALLLSGFTSDAFDLLVGVNLGGLGTLIASMASLISFKLIAKENIKSGKYVLHFTAVNIVFLALNLLLRTVID